MRHLKTYNLFENSNSELVSDVKDIFLDLSDEGFNVDVGSNPSGVNVFYIDINGKFGFNWSEFDNMFIRAKEYIEENSQWKLYEVSIKYETDKLRARVISSQKELNEYSYSDLKSNEIYEIGAYPQGMGSYYKIFLPNSRRFHIIHNRHITLLPRTEHSIFDKDNSSNIFEDSISDISYHQNMDYKINEICYFFEK